MTNSLMRMACGALLAVGLLGGAAPARAAAPGGKLAPGPHDIDLGEVRLHYVVRGHGPLVLVASPGWGPGSLYLQRGLAPLEKDLTLLFIDMRGSGGSARPADRSRMSQSVMADDIDRLRVALGLGSIDLLGHSDGGIIAIDYAERYPDHLRKLVLVETAVLGDRERPATRAFLEAWAEDPHYRDAVKAVKTQPASFRTDAEFERSLTAMLPLYVSDPDRLGPVLAKELAGGRLSAFAYAAEDEAERKAARNQAKELGNIRARTLIINGTIDWICPYQVAQRLHAAIPGSTLSLYANKDHIPWIEDPPRFFHEVAGFIRN